MMKQTPNFRKNKAGLRQEEPAFAFGLDDSVSEPPSPEALRGKALALLTLREHSQAELREKLQAKGGKPADVEAVIEDLVESRLQSNERFAEAFVRSRVVRGRGPQVIRAELKSRGLDADAAAEALGAASCDWLAQAAEVRERRFGSSLPAEQKEKARQIRFLQYRGFTGAQISRVLRGALVDED
jgi:regulatory protein